MNSNKNSNNKKKKYKQNNFGYDFVKITGALPALLWFRPKVIYKNKAVRKQLKKGGFLISSNHVTFVDPIILMTALWFRRVFFLATKELYSTKIVSALFNAVHCIKVDRDNFTMQAMHEVCDRLNAGQALLIFPEGQINQTNDAMLTLKSGVILMAHKGRAPILPVYIIPAKRWYNRTTVLVGEPIDVREICGIIPNVESIEKASEKLHEKELELLNYYNNLSK